jgi:predicted ArsR family transcriptional regulator
MTQRDAIAAAAVLDDAVRLRLLHLVSGSANAVTRDGAAAALGVPRSTVAFHLDRLVEAGLLTAEYQRVNGRAGPGAGRPSKTYSRAVGELSISFPERHYDLMGELLATAIENAPDAASARFALQSAATLAGREAGNRAGTFAQLLAETGYEPSAGPNGTVLRNCPFHRLARRHSAVVCAANQAFLCAAANATGGDPRNVLLEPTAEGCCIRIAS